MKKPATFLFIYFYCTLWFQISLSQGPPRRNIYASILQDSRNEPTPDGTFGYLYKTEDGIVSRARGGPNGVIQGGFSYTDPTGLKVNINYNAGSRTSPTATEPPSRRSKTNSGYYGNEVATRPRAQQPVYRQEPQYYDDYAEEPQPQPQRQPQPQPRYISRPRYVYRQPNNYQPRTTAVDNEIYDDYGYRG